MSKYKVLKDNLKNVVGEEFEKTLPIIAEEYETIIKRQAAEITRLLAENKELKEDFEKSKIVNLNIGRLAGQNEAWELARKIVLKNGYSAYDLHEIFNCCGSHQALENYTYSEAAAKVAEWEKAKEEIKVGDVVRFKNNNRIEFCVTDILDDSFLYGINAKGGLYVDRDIKLFEKTGRHIDIDSFLKQIGGEKNEDNL